MRISTFWAGWSGPKRFWNLTEGPVTLGLLPAAYRHTRIAELKAESDFARKLGVTQLATHAGFIPENPHDPEFAGMMDALREVAQHCRNNGQKFLFETGQETPVALLRAMQMIGTDNLGINLDTANVTISTARQTRWICFEFSEGTSATFISRMENGRRTAGSWVRRRPWARAMWTLPRSSAGSER